MNRSDEIVDSGVNFLSGLVRRMGFAVTVEGGEQREQTLVLRLLGDAGNLSRNRQILEAVALLTSRAVSVGSGERVHCQIDVDGRWGRREAMLAAAAGEIAGYVQETGRSAIIESLASSERRVIHLGLAESGRVQTRSEGDGEDRALVISPNDGE